MCFVGHKFNLMRIVSLKLNVPIVSAYPYLPPRFLKLHDDFGRVTITQIIIIIIIIVSQQLYSSSRRTIYVLRTN